MRNKFCWPVHYWHFGAGVPTPSDLKSRRKQDRMWVRSIPFRWLHQTVRQVGVFLSNVTLSTAITFCWHRCYVTACDNACWELHNYSSQQHKNTSETIQWEYIAEKPRITTPAGSVVSELRATRRRNRRLFLVRGKELSPLKALDRFWGLAQTLTVPGLKGKTDDTTF